MSFESKIDNFKNLIVNVSTIDPAEETIVIEYGVDNNVISDYATLLTAIEFIIDKYDGNPLKTLDDQHKIKMKALYEFADFSTNQTDATRTMKQIKYDEIALLFKNTQLKIDNYPITVHPLAKINRKVPDTKFIQFVEMNIDEVQKKFIEARIIVLQKFEELIKNSMNPDYYEKCIKPCDQYMYEKSLKIWYFGNIMKKICDECQIDDRHWKLDEMSIFKSLTPMATAKIQSQDQVNGYIRDIASLMNDEQKREFFDQLHIKDETDLQEALPINWKKPISLDD